MPTADRRRFLPQAIRQFLAQDYPDKELVILDDGADSVADLVPENPQVRYLRLERKLTLGAKRNECARISRGDIILHWDDDDWMADWRISYQVSRLLERNHSICGLDRLLYYETASGKAWEYIYPRGQRPWLAGNTFCYRKTFW